MNLLNIDLISLDLAINRHFEQLYDAHILFFEQLSSFKYAAFWYFHCDIFNTEKVFLRVRIFSGYSQCCFQLLLLLSYGLVALKERKRTVELN